MVIFEFDRYVTRRAKVEERLMRIGLLEAQARSSRVFMFLPSSLELAETELRFVHALTRAVSYTSNIAGQEGNTEI